MGIKVFEDKGYDSAIFDWDKITHSLEPEISKLPVDDKRYFSGIIKLLVGKDIRLSNIKNREKLYYYKAAEFIFNLYHYPMVIPKDFVRKKIAEYENKLGLNLSEDALAWKWGPMGFQTSHVKQEIVQPMGEPTVKR